MKQFGAGLVRMGTSFLNLAKQEIVDFAGGQLSVVIHKPQKFYKLTPTLE
ncbi:MAG: hypothetical protein LBJ98_05330 [Endomicrobium sp.]|nr:hypothetical protein [Endomicrobium sp.]